MIRMFMGDKDVVDLFKGNVHILKDFEDSISPAGIYHKKAAGVVADTKTGVVAAGDSSIACAKNLELFHRGTTY